MKIINKNNVKAREDTCGLIRELFASKNFSISHVTLVGQAKIHSHNKMEELYYIENGKGQLMIDNKIIELKTGDIVSIPKNSWHYLKNSGKKPLEIIVINSPAFNSDDVIMRP